MTRARFLAGVFFGDAAHFEILAGAGGDGNAILRVLRVVNVLAVVAVAAQEVADEGVRDIGIARAADDCEVAHEVVTVEDFFFDAHHAEQEKPDDAGAVRADAAVEIGRQIALRTPRGEDLAYLVREVAVVVGANLRTGVIAPSETTVDIRAVARRVRIKIGDFVSRVLVCIGKIDVCLA